MKIQANSSTNQPIQVDRRTNSNKQISNLAISTTPFLECNLCLDGQKRVTAEAESSDSPLPAVGV